MSELEKITSISKNGKTYTKYSIKQVQQPKKQKEQPKEQKEQREPKKQQQNKKIKVSTPKEKFFLYVKSKVPLVKISKGRVVKTSSTNKNKFYPYHSYIFKQNRNGENNIYLETRNDDGSYYLKKLFKTEFDEIELSCEGQTQKIKLRTKFSFKHGKFEISLLKPIVSN